MQGTDGCVRVLVWLQRVIEINNKIGGRRILRQKIKIF